MRGYFEIDVWFVLGDARPEHVLSHSFQFEATRLRFALYAGGGDRRDRLLAADAWYSLGDAMALVVARKAAVVCPRR